MNSPPPAEPPPSSSPLRRIVDMLAIVASACGLLGLAWMVARDRRQVEHSPRADSIAKPQLPDTPELQLLLPLEKFGMVLTREHVAGHSQQALASLDLLCQEVLDHADQWVLSLAVSPEEQQLLDSLSATQALPGSRHSPHPLAQLYPLTQPTGRAGIREGSGAAAGQRVICWGFILSDGAEGHTVWFARPREKLPGSVTQEGQAP